MNLCIQYCATRALRERKKLKHDHSTCLMEGYFINGGCVNSQEFSCGLWLRPRGYFGGFGEQI